MQSILNQIDQFYTLNQYEEAYQYMLKQLEEAMIHKQDNIILGLLSELMGYYRVRAEFLLGNQMAIQAIKIIENLGLDKTIPSATTYLNIATLYRVQGLYKESSMHYQKAFNIYQQLLDESDERYISLYNNMSLLYQEINQLEQAIEYELKALSLIKDKENCEVETAITYTNLSQMYLTKNDYDEGMKFLNQATDLFLQYAPQDPHYFATLASMAQAHYLKKEYTEALHIYEDVLEKIENTYGQNKDYQTVYDNYLLVQQKLNNQSFGLKLSRDYYYEIGKPMLEAKFSKYLPYMAIGLVGMGSECLGYDDKLSQDHDFGPGFCIWLPKEVYETIGQSLQVAYNQLPQEFQGYQRQISSRGQNRVGVFEIENFYKMYLGTIPHTNEEWLYLDENALLNITSGEIFEDHYGMMSKIRKELAYYPEDIRIKKIARSIAKMAQSGQYNYARCMQRKESVAATLAIYEFVKETFSCLYLLNKVYQPYYKWVYRGTTDLVLLKDIPFLIKQLLDLENQSQCWNEESSNINYNDQKIVIIEKICRFIINELHSQNLSTQTDNFLELHVDEVVNHIGDVVIRNKHIMEG